MKYNLIFVFADQWRRDSVGYMNKEDVISPNIDAFSKDSLNFENAFCTGPLCSPSRASILTGTYPQTHGVWTNCKIGLPNVYLKEDAITITDVLKKNDYYIGYIGKWHLDNPEMNISDNPESGARDWDAYTPPGAKRHGVDYWYSYGAFNDHLKPHYWHNSNKMIQIDKWSVEHETDVALEFLEKNKEKPFALFLSYNPPHTPLDLVPDKYLKMYENKEIKVNPNVVLENVIDHTKTLEKPFNFTMEEHILNLKKYYAAISGIDENFGRIIKYLKENNLYDNSIIVLTADHGEMMCGHALWSKHVWYEESISIPFLIKANTKGKTETVISGVDIMPTLLSLLDIEIPKEVEGTDLSESIKEDKYIENDAYISAFPGSMKAINEFRKNNLDNLAYGWRAIRDKRYTYVVNKGYTPYEKVEKYLYDNYKDQYQLKPILNESKIKEMETKLRNWLEKYNDKFEI